MVKGTYQLSSHPPPPPPTTTWNCPPTLNLSTVESHIIRPMNFTTKGSKVLLTFGIVNTTPSFCGTRHKLGLALPLWKLRIGSCSLLKSLANWRHVLEDDLDVTHTGQWVGFYREGTEDLAFVYQCSANCTPSCMHPHHLSMPLPFKLHSGHPLPIS